MTMLKKTKVVYNSEDTPSETQEILVDAVFNLDHICAVLPGKRPGYLTVIMNNKMRYTLKDTVESLFEREKKKGQDDKVR